MVEDCYNGCIPFCAHRTDGLCYWGGVAQKAQALADAVQRYVEPKKGDTYCSRTEILRLRDELKRLLK